ncbi:ABC transporter ATP-binding protein [Thermoleptolyngbya sp. M55_K2018_002]|uniref:ABC transporter ATP-binding protein n=1 Tax=Thermoleptolyngbya sp. M55_K2018_002 TaxID=2747808 RepID=UPI0019E62C33|nr:ABC transporter ATP-binding protein [Thermoleptolyngbya sp. M55_K2018_002]HIK42721.1 ABC transporter ATP-binding protein [Thermoleptolyngbya sp. M55_K2018_002]
MAISRFQRLRQYLRPHWRLAAGGILALLLVNGIGVYIPLLLRSGIDELQQTFSFGRVTFYAGWIFALASVMWGMRILSRIWLFGVGRLVEFDLKQRIFSHLLTMEPAYFAENTVGDLISRATSDVDNIRRLLGFAVLSLANTIFAYALTLPVMLSIDVRLTVVAIAIYPLMFFLVHLFSDRLRNQQLQVQQRTSDLSDLIQEDISGIALIKIYAQEENERQAFAERNQNLLKANLALARTRTTLFPLLGGLASISLLVLLALGAGEIASGRISIGDFLAMLLYVERLVFPTALLGFTITAYQRGEVSIDRVEYILAEQPKIDDAPDAIHLPRSEVQGWLCADHLSFTYPGATRPALDGVSFKIRPGETVAIVGPIGSGKSTLANALPRLLDIAPGQVYLDGYDITQIRLRDLRGAIAYVPQESFLFSTTIKNNIRYGDPKAGQDEVEAAAKQSQIHPEILNFPQQYKTIVGERGITLSGGQRQRTALARALLIDAPVLILDDALSSVDNQTATEILTNLREGTQRKTVLFITHQLSAAALSDRILVMDGGRIVQSGHHADLLAQPGLYQTLWEQQKLEEILQ